VRRYSFPNRHHHEAKKNGVNHASGKKQRDKNVVMTFLDVMMHVMARQRYAAHGIGYRAADEQNRHQKTVHRIIQRGVMANCDFMMPPLQQFDGGKIFQKALRFVNGGRAVNPSVRIKGF
jgi:hypothetical protein